MTLMAYLIYFVNSKDLTPFFSHELFLDLSFSAMNCRTGGMSCRFPA